MKEELELTKMFVNKDMIYSQDEIIDIYLYFLSQLESKGEQ